MFDSPPRATRFTPRCSVGLGTGAEITLVSLNSRDMKAPVRVTLLTTGEELVWYHDNQGMTFFLPGEQPETHAFVMKI